MEKETKIIEFEVIAPTNNMEKIGEKLELSDFGEYCPEASLRGYSLLFLLDHTLHYRVSKIMMQGKVYIIPANRKKNYSAERHPEEYKFSKMPQRYKTTGDYKEPLVGYADGEYIKYNEVQHLF